MALSHTENKEKKKIIIEYTENTTIGEFMIYYTELISYFPERTNWTVEFKNV